MATTIGIIAILVLVISDTGGVLNGLDAIYDHAKKAEKYIECKERDRWAKSSMEWTSKPVERKKRPKSSTQTCGN